MGKAWPTAVFGIKLEKVAMCLVGKAVLGTAAADWGPTNPQDTEMQSHLARAITTLRIQKDHERILKKTTEQLEFIHRD